MKILVLCTGNSCRSQMAHGFLKNYRPEWQICSAGTNPSGRVNPKAIEVMSQIGIDISAHVSESVNRYLDEYWDYVITVCGGAKETCPSFHGEVGKHLHIGFEDPSDFKGSPEAINQEYVRVRNAIGKRFLEFCNEIESI